MYMYLSKTLYMYKANITQPYLIGTVKTIFFPNSSNPMLEVKELSILKRSNFNFLQSCWRWLDTSVEF